MNFAKIKFPDVANGEGVRVSLFVSGCRNHCRGCFNPETWRFDYGEEFTEKTEKYILECLGHEYVNGLSLLGGDPLEPENIQVLIPFLKRVKERYPNKTVWLYTGYSFELVNKGPYREVLNYVDILVDGPFVMDLKNVNLRFRGSSNQRIIDVPATFEAGWTILWKGVFE